MLGCAGYAKTSKQGGGMNAIQMQMLNLFQLSCEPIIKKYDIRLEIDWSCGNVNFITEKNITQIELQQFLTEMTAVIQKNPIMEAIL